VYAKSVNGKTVEPPPIPNQLRVRVEVMNPALDASQMATASEVVPPSVHETSVSGGLVEPPPIPVQLRVPVEIVSAAGRGWGMGGDNDSRAGAVGVGIVSTATSDSGPRPHSRVGAEVVPVPPDDGGMGSDISRRAGGVDVVPDKSLQTTAPEIVFLSVNETSVGGGLVEPPPISEQPQVRVDVVPAAADDRGMGSDISRRAGGGDADVATSPPDAGSPGVAVHSLRLRLSGPSHMGVAIPESRLSAWSFGADSRPRPRPPQSRRSPFAPHERVAFAFLTCGSAAASATPTGGTAAPGGVPPAPCVWELLLEVRGSEPLPLAVYGHYVQLTRSEPLEALSAALEPRLRGDWHWFSSMIERVTLQMPQQN
jgi:hypothetical protein